MHLSNHLPPRLPCRSLSAHTISLPLLPLSVSSLRHPVDSNHRAACNRLGVMGHRLLDPSPAKVIREGVGGRVREKAQFRPIEQRFPLE